jgi:Flp pilus assembly CpaF family ATPase
LDQRRRRLLHLEYKKYEGMIKSIDEIFNDPDQYGNLYNIDRNQAELELNLYSELKNKAALGEQDARKYLINKYSILLRQIYDLNDETIEEYINFKKLQDNNVQILFEMLLELYDISELIERYALPIQISERDIRRIIEDEKENIHAHFILANKLKLLALIIYSREYGQDIIDSLQHHNINEIGVIDKEYVYIVHKGIKIHLNFLCFNDNSIIENIQKKTTQNSTINYDRQNPTVVTAKNNSSRITVAGYDITPTEEDLYYNERIFNLKKITLEDMRDSYMTINDVIYQFLVMNQNGRGSHFVTGSDMGVGKSTFLLAMMEKVPDKWGIGILDTQNELQAKKKYPWKNILTLLVNTKRTIAQCFEFMLKTARDVLYVGEITMPSEVAELINASLRLNSGVGATLHSLSPFEVVTNVRNLMMRTEMYNDASLAEADIARGLDLIIHLSKLNDGRIIVESILEVQHVELDYFRNPVLEGSYKEKLMNLCDMAQLALQKYLYSKRYRYNQIIKFDYDLQKWITMNLPSERYFEKIGKYVQQKDIEEMKQLLYKDLQRVG